MISLLGQLAFKLLGWAVPWASPRLAKYMVIGLLGFAGTGYVWVKGYCYAKDRYEQKLANLKWEQENRVTKAHRARRAVRAPSSRRVRQDPFRRD